MNKSEYLKKYLAGPSETSDYKKPKRKKSKSSKKTLVPSLKIIDNDILPWNDKVDLEIDRNFTDIGIDAPTIVEDFEDTDSKLKIKNAKKWKNFEEIGEKKTQGRRNQRHDSSDSDSDSDLDVRSQTKSKKKYSNSDDDDSNSGRESDPKYFTKVEKGQEKTVFRDKTGRRYNLMQKRIEDEERARKRNEKLQLWKDWSAGEKQLENKKKLEIQETREIAKPLARYANDKDLEIYQKSIKRIDDPMEKYFKSKNEKMEKKLGKFPEYRGLPPEPNRFNINPGYRWDGVDRGNGFEKRYFSRVASMNSLKEHEIRYMTEDM